MDIIAEYRQRAQECEQLAKQVKSPEQRRAILKIAASWRELADGRQTMLRQRASQKLPNRPW
jgi:hypothetical protein